MVSCTAPPAGDRTRSRKGSVPNSTAVNDVYTDSAAAVTDADADAYADPSAL
jgi:hypothetical protein